MARSERQALTGTTGVLGVIGDPIAHSLSPAMQNAALEALGLDYIYVPFHVSPLCVKEAIAGMKALGIRGLNVTIPHKVAVLQYMDEVEPVAGLIGAVNTISNEDGCLIGYNTDACGFLISLRKEADRDVQGQRVTILGAGGSARAIGFQLAVSEIEQLVIANRTRSSAVALAEEISRKTGCPAAGVGLDEVEAQLPSTDILVNTTPLGMHPRVDTMPPVNLRKLPASALVCDIVYNPSETLLLKNAAACGLQTLPGLGMLVYQGAAALEIWLKVSPPTDVMKAAVQRELENRNGS